MTIKSKFDLANTVIRILLIFILIIISFSGCTILGVTGGILIDEMQHYEIRHPSYENVKIEVGTPVTLILSSDKLMKGKFSQTSIIQESAYSEIFLGRMAQSDSLKPLLCLNDTVEINSKEYLLTGFDYSRISTIRLSDLDTVHMDLSNFTYLINCKGDSINSMYISALMNAGTIPFNWSLSFHHKGDILVLPGNEIKIIKVEPYTYTPFLTTLIGICIDYLVISNIDLRQ